MATPKSSVLGISGSVTFNPSHVTTSTQFRAKFMKNRYFMLGCDLVNKMVHVQVIQDDYSINIAIYTENYHHRQRHDVSFVMTKQDQNKAIAY